MKHALFAAAVCAALAVPAVAQESCPLTLEGRWIDDAASNVKGKLNQPTGFLLRRQGEGYYLTAIYDSGAKAIPRGYFKGSATELKTKRVLGQDDLTMMFQGSVVGPIAVAQIAERRPSVVRTYTLAPDGNTIAVAGETIAAQIEPNGTLHHIEHQDISYKSFRAPWPKPCQKALTAAEWDAFKAKANAYRDAKDKPVLTDDVRQFAVMGLDAVNAKNFDEALNQFEGGLALDPLWTNGHFNAAMVYAQMGDYEDAAYHMKAYLELTPASEKDFEANRDRILLWQGKLKQQMAEPLQSATDD